MVTLTLSGWVWWGRADRRPNRRLTAVPLPGRQLGQRDLGATAAARPGSAEPKIW